MDLVATSLDGPVSSWFNSLSEADAQDWSTLTLKFRKKFDSVTAQSEVQAEAQNVQLNTHECNSFYGCRVEDFVKKGWPDYDVKMRNREDVVIFIQGLPFKLKQSATKKN